MSVNSRLADGERGQGHPAHVAGVGRHQREQDDGDELAAVGRRGAG